MPGRHDYRIVFATWDKVTRHPRELLHELGPGLFERDELRGDQPDDVPAELRLDRPADLTRTQ